VTDLLRGRAWPRPGALDHDQICAALLASRSSSTPHCRRGDVERRARKHEQSVPVLASDIEGNRSGQSQTARTASSRVAGGVPAKRGAYWTTRPLRAVMGHRAQVKSASQFRLEGEIGKYLASTEISSPV